MKVIIVTLSAFRLYGDYESLAGGYTADALVDFTGGVAEKLVVSEMSLSSDALCLKFFREIMTSVENKSLVTTCVAVNILIYLSFD